MILDYLLIVMNSLSYLSKCSTSLSSNTPKVNGHNLYEQLDFVLFNGVNKITAHIASNHPKYIHFTIYFISNVFREIRIKFSTLGQI